MKKESEKELIHLAACYDGIKSGPFDCNNDCFMMRFDAATQQIFQTCLDHLEQSGYTLYDQRNIRDNYFATYTNSSYLLHLYHTAHDHVTRIMIDPNLTLYQKEMGTCKKQCDTTLYQMELDYKTIDCGMCYIIQCCDKSFFIIDSAHMNSVNDHIRLHTLLRNLTPRDEKIIISGWFFSHAHQDHIVKFMDFMNAGFTDYKIEALYYNFPSLSVPGSQKWSESDKQTMREFHQLIKNHKDIPVIKLHTGQQFFIRNLQFETLSTHEDLYPEPLDQFNNSSTILLMTVDGCKTLFLGDANVAACTIVIARYGSYIKSDIVQVAHHGYNHENVGIYYCADSRVALYPTRQDKYDNNQFTASNKKVISMCDEIYIAGNGTAALKLPYIPNTAKVFPKEVN